MEQSKSSIIRQYFEANPEKLEGGFGKTARELGYSYNLVHNIATEIRQKNFNFKKFESTSGSQTIEEGYDSIEHLKDNNSLKSYCEAYGIPYEYVTSAKFVNHTFQEVWNVVCDTTKLTPAYLDIYFEKLRGALSKVIIPQKQKPKLRDNEAAYQFYHSDKHIGAMTKANSLYKNEWNSKIFRLRLLRTLEDYKEEAELRGRFDKVLVTDLGDAVDGWNKGTTRNGKGSSHILPQNMDNRETFDVYVAVMCEFFDHLVELDLANDIEFIAVTNDNHGGSFSYIVNRAVEIYLNLKYPWIKTRVSKEFFVDYKYGEHGFLFTHGKDEEHQKHGYPLNIDEKSEKKLNQFIRRKGLRKDVKCFHVVKGDLHQENQNLTESFRYRNCLSLYGPSGWSMMNFGYNHPGSSYDIVYKNRQKVLTGYILFDEE